MVYHLWYLPQHSNWLASYNAETKNHIRFIMQYTPMPNVYADDIMSIYDKHVTVSRKRFERERERRERERGERERESDIRLFSVMKIRSRYKKEKAMVVGWCDGAW